MGTGCRIVGVALAFGVVLAGVPAAWSSAPGGAMTHRAVAPAVAASRSGLAPVGGPVVRRPTGVRALRVSQRVRPAAVRRRAAQQRRACAHSAGALPANSQLPAAALLSKAAVLAKVGGTRGVILSVQLETWATYAAADLAPGAVYCGVAPERMVWVVRVAHPQHSLHSQGGVFSPGALEIDTLDAQTGRPLSVEVMGTCRAACGAGPQAAP